MPLIVLVLTPALRVTSLKVLPSPLKVSEEAVHVILEVPAMRGKRGLANNTALPLDKDTSEDPKSIEVVFLILDTS